LHGLPLGHKWLVVAVLVRFSFTRRLWALPVPIALYHSEKENSRRGRRHKTPTQLPRQLLRVLLRWFPQRQFVCAADGDFATHDLARLASRYPQRLTYLRHFYADANLYEPAPAEEVKQAKHRQRLNVAWYGGGRRDVEVVTGTAHWYEAGASLAAVLWVWVHDCTGTHRDEYFFTTDGAGRRRR